MKCNLEKFNQFFNNENIEQDIKDFVLKMYKKFFKDDYDNTHDIIKVFFIDLGFYKTSKDDKFNDEEYRVFDFYKLSRMNPAIRKIILDGIYKNLVSGDSSEFLIDFLEETKLSIQYEKWEKINRKNKLVVLNEISINTQNDREINKIS